MFDDPKVGDTINSSGLRLGEVQVGDPVLRIMCGCNGMRLTITEIAGDRVKCGSWEFDRLTGAEIDEDMDWGPNSSGSFIAIPRKGPEAAK